MWVTVAWAANGTPGPAACASQGKGFGTYPPGAPPTDSPLPVSGQTPASENVTDPGVIAQNCLLECGPLGLGNRFPTPPRRSERLFVPRGRQP